MVAAPPIPCVSRSPNPSVGVTSSLAPEQTVRPTNKATAYPNLKRDPNLSQSQQHRDLVYVNSRSDLESRRQHTRKNWPGIQVLRPLITSQLSSPSFQLPSVPRVVNFLSPSLPSSPPSGSASWSCIEEVSSIPSYRLSPVPIPPVNSDAESESVSSDLSPTISFYDSRLIRRFHYPFDCTKALPSASFHQIRLASLPRPRPAVATVRLSMFFGLSHLQWPKLQQRLHQISPICSLPIILLTLPATHSDILILPHPGRRRPLRGFETPPVPRCPCGW